MLSATAKNFAADTSSGPVLPLADADDPAARAAHSYLILRPATLSVRLTGNLFGDHTVFNIMSGLVPPCSSRCIFLGLATLVVSVIQAFVFSSA